MGVLRSIYRRNCALFEESMKVSMDKLWDILNKFRGGHKWNMQVRGRGTSFQNGYPTVYGIALIMTNEHTDSGIFLLLKVKIYFHSASAYLARGKPQFGGKALLEAKNFGGLGQLLPVFSSVRPSLAGTV